MRFLRKEKVNSVHPILLPLQYDLMSCNKTQCNRCDGMCCDVIRCNATRWNALQRDGVENRYYISIISHLQGSVKEQC